MTTEERIEKLEERIKKLESLTNQVNDMLADHGYSEGEGKD